MNTRVVAGYRKMTGKNQSEMATLLGLSEGGYRLKETGKLEFSDIEKIKFTEEVNKVLPKVTVLDIFFSQLVL